MTAYNAVRFRVRPGMERDFEAAIRQEMQAGFPGLAKAVLIKTGEQTYCEIGEWDSYDSIVAARPAMIAGLDKVRHMLEELGDGLGVTDAVSGQAVATFVRGGGESVQPTA